MNDDLISRQAAIDALCNGKCDEEGRWCDDGDCLPVRRIKSLPAAEPKQRIGQWIYGQDELFVSCSECGMETTRNEIRGIALFGKDEPKFCPNCGAKMKKESEDYKNNE